MNFEFSEEQLAFAQSLERRLAQACPRSAVRQAVADGQGLHEPSWRALADLGVLGCAIPSEYGGHGLGVLELAVAAEQIGACLAPVPACSSIYVFALALIAEGTHEQQARLLPKIASGAAIGTSYFGPGLSVARNRVRGRAAVVADGAVATVALLLCDDAEGRTPYLVTLDHNVGRRPLDCLDPSKPQCELTFEGVACERIGANGGGWTLADLAIERAATLLAFEQVGGARAALATALAYVHERETFGRVIGSYQAIKHKLVDAWVKIELARVHTTYAAWALATNSPDFPLAAASARASATEAFQHAAREALHVHGGVGFTWEADCHLFYRRARALASLFGPARAWRSLVAERLERGERTVQ